MAYLLLETISIHDRSARYWGSHLYLSNIILQAYWRRTFPDRETSSRSWKELFPGSCAIRFRTRSFERAEWLIWYGMINSGGFLRNGVYSILTLCLYSWLDPLLRATVRKNGPWFIKIPAFIMLDYNIPVNLRIDSTTMSSFNGFRQHKKKSTAPIQHWSTGILHFFKIIVSEQNFYLNAFIIL